MELEHIRTVICPHCGCKEITMEAVSNKHSSGDWNEVRNFACGYKLHYYPNMDRIEHEGECVRSEQYKEIHQKRAQAREVIIAFVEGMDVDDAYKEWFLRQLRSYVFFSSSEVIK